MRYLRILALVALCLAYAPTPALAVTGYDSAYNSESAFVTIDPGETKGFQVFFINTGTLTWIKGSTSQVDLAACLEDKVTCNTQDASEASWNSGWLSTGRYATTTQASVAPNGVATFSYNIKAPANATGTHRFNGDLVVASSGARIHPEGYFQDAKVNAIGQTGPTPSPSPSPTPAPAPAASTNPLLCFDGTTDTANNANYGPYGGICTRLANGALLNNTVPVGGGDYSGVYYETSRWTGKMPSQVTSLSFDYAGTPPPYGGAPRIALPINGEGSTYAFIAAADCNDGAGHVSATTDSTCTIFVGSEPATNPGYPNWAAFAAAYSAWTVGTTPFVITDVAGAWTVSNVHLGE